MTDDQIYVASGYVVKDKKTARSAAAHFLARPVIQKKIKDLQDKVDRQIIKKQLYDKETMIRDLVEIKDRCMQKVPVMVFSHIDKQMVQKEDEAGNGVWEFEGATAVRAIAEAGKVIGAYEIDNKQKNNLSEILTLLQKDIGMIEVGASTEEIEE